MASQRYPPRVTAQRRTLRELGAVGYTPQAARLFGEAMLVLCESSEFHRKRALAAFAKIANQKCKWPIVGERS